MADLCGAARPGLARFLKSVVAQIGKEVRLTDKATVMLRLGITTSFVFFNN